jgi:hypothetical protein
MGENVNLLKQITVSRGEVVGIGKVKIPRTQDFNYEIQMLSFLVIKKSKDSFVSTCIHLHMDGYGKTPREANKDMAENIYFFLKENFSKLPPEDAWNNIWDLSKSDNWSNELWDAYRAVQIQLSMQGRSTDNKEMLEVMEESIVDYTPVNEAA